MRTMFSTAYVDANGGFCNWPERLSCHELSKEHVNAFTAFRTRFNNLRRIDCALQ